MAHRTLVRTQNLRQWCIEFIRTHPHTCMGHSYPHSFSERSCSEPVDLSSEAIGADTSVIRVAFAQRIALPGAADAQEIRARHQMMLQARGERGGRVVRFQDTAAAVEQLQTDVDVAIRARRSRTYAKFSAIRGEAKHVD